MRIDIMKESLELALLIDNTSSMYLYVNLNWNASCFYPRESKVGMYSDSYEKNVSSRSDAQLVSKGIPTIVNRENGPIVPPNTTKMLLKLYCGYLYTRPCMINHILGLKQL